MMFIELFAIAQLLFKTKGWIHASIKVPGVDVGFCVT
jgi:hypothetical protein